MRAQGCKTQLRRFLLRFFELVVLAFAIQWLAERVEPPFEWLERLTELGPILFGHTGYTVKRFVAGYLLAVCTGVPLGLLIGQVRCLEEIAEIPIEILRPIPAAVIIPFGIAFLGIGESMKIFVIWFGAFWPLLIYTLGAARNVAPILHDVAKVFHLSPWQRLIRLVLPAIVPEVLNAGRVSLSIALLLTVTVEMIAGGERHGLGFFIIDAERSFRRADMVVAVVMVAALGILSNLLYRTLERAIKNWRYQYVLEHHEGG